MGQAEHDPQRRRPCALALGRVDREGRPRRSAGREVQRWRKREACRCAPRGGLGDPVPSRAQWMAHDGPEAQARPDREGSGRQASRSCQDVGAHQQRWRRPALTRAAPRRPPSSRPWPMAPCRAAGEVSAVAHAPGVRPEVRGRLPRQRRAGRPAARAVPCQQNEARIRAASPGARSGDDSPEKREGGFWLCRLAP